MKNDKNQNPGQLTTEEVKAKQSIITVIKEKINKWPSWAIVTLIAIFFMIIFCLIPIILIDITKQWCNLFPDFFNTITPGVCG